MSSAQEAQAEKATTATTEFDGAKWLETAANRMRLDDESARKRGLDALSTFIERVLDKGQVVSADVETNIKFWINAIDQKLTAQLNEILHEPAFQRLEGTWRGLFYLVDQ